MWQKTENGSAVRPSAADTTSSRSYVYVRKNILFCPERLVGEETRPAHYEWDELKVPRKDWETFRSVLAHGEALEDVYAALAELAALIAEV